MDDSTKVKLIMDDGRADGLEVRRLTLKEGVCRIPTAEVVLWSNARAIKMAALSDYVERPAALEISRTDADPSAMRRTIRWFSGMVTSVEGCGVVAHGRDGNVFEYHMTIQPRLVNLCYSRSGHNFCKVKALDAVREILKGVDKVTYDTADLPASAQMEQDFFQYRESDYGFLMRVLASCGLCYAFKTPAQGADGAVRMPEMYVGPGKNMPAASEFLVNGREGGAIPSAFSCSAIRTDGRFCRMDSWRMRKSIGVDSLDVGYTNRSGADVRGSAGKGDVRHVKMYEGLSADAKQSEIERLAEESLARIRLSTMGWAGSTQCLEAMPGQYLKVNHFYGEDETDVITALVIASTMDCTLPVFVGRVNLDDGAKVSVNIAIRCLSDSKDEVSGAQSMVSAVGGGLLLGATPDNTLQPSANLGEIPTANGGGGGGGVLGGGGGGTIGGGGGGGLTLPCVTQATVAGADDDTTNTNKAVKFIKGDDKKTKYVFKARLVGGSENVVEVNFTQAVGGYGQGLFRMPRIGDRVLLFAQPQSSGVDSTYYLLGYLPGDTMPFTTTTELERATRVVQKDTGKVTEPDVALPEEMMSLRFRSPGKVDTLMDSVMAQPVSIRRNETDNVCSEIGFYNTHVGKNLDKNFKESDDDGKKVLANFQSSGNMQLTANDRLELNAKNMHLCSANRSGWKQSGGEYNMDDCTGNLYINDFNKVLIDVKRSITLKVGRNYITISQNGISIRSLKRTETGGPMDSYIYLDAISGTSIGGMNCSMNGFMGVDLTDRLGGAVSVGCGSASMTGVCASVNTFSLPPFIVNVGLAAKDIFSQIAGFANKDSTTVADNVWVAQSTIDTAWEILRTVRDIVAFAKSDKKADGNDVVRLIQNVLKVIAAIMDLVRIGIEAKHEAWMSQPVAHGPGKFSDSDGSGERDYMTNRDVFRYTVLATKAANMLVNVIGTFIAMATTRGLKVLNVTTLTMRQGTLELETAECKALSQTKLDDQTAISGIPANNVTINNISYDKLPDKLPDKVLQDSKDT